MKSVIICSAIFLIAFVSQACAEDCEKVTNPDDSDFKNFFKSLGCKVKQGAEDIADAAKPYTDKIGEGAKDFGSTVAHKYDELKHRLTDDPSTPKPTAGVQYDGPTEKLLLAPIAPAPVPADNAQPAVGKV